MVNWEKKVTRCNRKLDQRILEKLWFWSGLQGGYQGTSSVDWSTKVQWINWRNWSTRIQGVWEKLDLRCGRILVRRSKEKLEFYRLSD
jgi:hypothetical protein